MDIRHAIKALAPFVDSKKTDLGFHAVRLDATALTATNGIDGAMVPASINDIVSCVPFDALKRVTASAPVGTVKLKKLRSKLAVTVGASRYEFKTLEPRFDVPDLPTEWFPVSEYETSLLRAMATIAKGSTNPEGIRLASGWFGAARQTMGIVATLPTFGGLSEPVTISPNIAKTLKGEQEVAYDGRRVWFRDPTTGEHRWTVPLAHAYPDALGDSMIPAAVKEPGRERFRVKLHDLAAVIDDAKLMTGSEEYPACVQGVHGALTVHIDTDRGNFHSKLDIGAPDTTRAGVTIPNADTLLSAFGSIVAVSEEVELVMCPPTEEQQRRPFVFVAEGDVVALLMPMLLS